jgi:hypothetical protein
LAPPTEGALVRGTVAPKGAANTVIVKSPTPPTGGALSKGVEVLGVERLAPSMGGVLADGIGAPEALRGEQPTLADGGRGASRWRRGAQGTRHRATITTARGVLANGAEALEVEVPRSDTVAWAACGGIPARTVCRSSEPTKWLVPTSRGGEGTIHIREKIKVG